MLARWGKFDAGEYNHTYFLDVPFTNRAFNYVAWAVNHSLVDNTAIKFRPEHPITQEEFCLILRRCTLGSDAKNNSSNLIGVSAEEGLDWAFAYQIITVIEPKKHISRAEAASMFYKTHGVITDTTLRVSIEEPASNLKQKLFGTQYRSDLITYENTTTRPTVFSYAIPYCTGFTFEIKLSPADENDISAMLSGRKFTVYVSSEDGNWQEVGTVTPQNNEVVSAHVQFLEKTLSRIICIPESNSIGQWKLGLNITDVDFKY
ncbi:MAG: hypothetical protein LBP73_04165 [Clostridiales Family XIII bacterium]|jgi:hypothetical protein|nr:hypothetical protein [Clostridiales Family XIII bacterium]